MANNGNECEEVHHRNVAICGREVVRTHVKKVRKGEKIDDGENNTVYLVVAIGVVLILGVMLVTVYYHTLKLQEDLAGAHEKNRELEGKRTGADEKNWEMKGKLTCAYMKNILLEEENKRLSNAKEEADKHIFLLKCFIGFMFIIIIAMILDSQHKN